MPVFAEPEARLRRKTLPTKPELEESAEVKTPNVATTRASRTRAAVPKAEKELTWGRHSSAELFNLLGITSLILGCPLLVGAFWIACDSYKGSLTALLNNFRNLGAALPQPSLNGFLILVGWIVFQGLLYALLPGKISQGQTTPAGFLLSYKTNGLRAWVVTHLAFYYLSVRYSLFSPTVIYDNWGALMIAANVYGYALGAFSYAKALMAPSHPEDRKFSGSWLYDFWMGIEFNPRFGKLWDFKLFHNGRPGIIGWTLINASFAAAQYKKWGFLSNSMVLVNILQAVYVLDFFIHEDWYLRTIDIAHDHFGLMLSWGDSVWLPFMYTLQARYLVETPVGLTQNELWGFFGLGLAGYLIFRLANNQKDLVRRTRGDCKVWGKPARFIRAKYRSADGKEHESILLTSGFWGLARHFNYTGDLMLSLAYCLACGTKSVLPYFYIIYMTILLVHRIYRDQARCLRKYGKYWEEYCREVPYKLIPLVF